MTVVTQLENICPFPGCSNDNLPAMQKTLGQENALEKGTAAHSNILAWRIPRTEESGGLQSMEFQRVWTQLSDLTLFPLINPNFIFQFKLLCCKTLPFSQYVLS